jgi:hypothetical protein
VGKRAVETIPLPLVAGFGGIVAALIVALHWPVSALYCWAAGWIILTGSVWIAQYRAKGATLPLQPTIIEAFCQPLKSPPNWLVFLKVSVENPDPAGTRIKEWQTRLTFGERHVAEFGGSFQHPSGPRWTMPMPGGHVRQFEYADFLEKQRSLNGKDHIDGIIPAMFAIAPVPFEWSEWSAPYRPPANAVGVET